MDKIIGLDMSTTSTGWALFDDDLKEYGVLKASESYMYERLLHMKQMIQEVLEKHEPEMVIIEEIPISDKSNLKVGKDLCLLQGLIIGVCDNLGIAFKMIEPSKWRARVGALRSIYTCNKCDHNFEAKSGLKHLECPECGNKAFSQFKKSPLNTRPELKKRAVDMVNTKYGLELYFKGKSSKNDDDIAESILLGLSERELNNGNI